MAECRSQAIRVLIVDDDHRVRTALSTLLCTEPEFDVVGAAATADRALTLARKRRPNIALVDILLPEAVEGLRLLRTMTSELHIPAIAMSIDGGQKRIALAAGAILFVDKDTTADRLITAVRTAAC